LDRTKPRLQPLGHSSIKIYIRGKSEK